MKIIRLISFLLLLQCFAVAQSLMQKRADILYEDLSYLSAAEYYKDLCKSKNVTENNIRKLADCYFKIYDFINAEISYKRLVDSYPNQVSIADLEVYLQILKYNEKYVEAEKVLSQIESKNNGNLIVKNHKKAENYYAQLKQDSLLYKTTNIKSLNTENSEFSPVYIKNKSQIGFASNRRNTSVRNKTFAWDDTYFIDVYTSQKKDSVNFDQIKNFNKDVTTLYHDGPITFSGDEKTIYITHTNALTKSDAGKKFKVINLKLYIIHVLENGQLSAPESFPYNSDDYSVGHAAITTDGKRIYFVSDMPGGFGKTDLYYCDFSNGKWSAPENLGPAINSEGREMFPYVFEDGTLFFSSDGRAGLGGLDIYFTVPDLDMYYEPQNLGYPINSNLDDFGFLLNSDLRSGYLSSNRSGGTGKDDIYYFNSRNNIIGCTLKGIVYDESDKHIIAGAKVYLKDKDGVIIDSTVSNNKGEYSFNIKDKNKPYFLTGIERSKYYDNTIPIGKLKDGENKQDIGLSPKYKLLCTVSDIKDAKPIEGVKCTLTDKISGAKKEYQTNTDGKFSDLLKDKKTGDKIDLSFRFEKEGYITVERTFSSVLSDNTIIELNEKLQKLEIGADIAKVIQVNSIYFDLDKATIRPDAAKELDKIAKAMHENPTMVIELGSHTDCRSSAAYNILLSDKRAKSSAAYIISKGISKERIYGKGYGESKLINKCECEGKKVTPCTEEEHQVNRRTEFIIVKY